ncbi:hypothetical protein GEMRC1_003266 [Eukaryota sp. GEM-RC1]
MFPSFSVISTLKCPRPQCNGGLLCWFSHDKDATRCLDLSLYNYRPPVQLSLKPRSRVTSTVAELTTSEPPVTVPRLEQSSESQSVRTSQKEDKLVVIPTKPQSTLLPKQPTSILQESPTQGKKLSKIELMKQKMQQKRLAQSQPEVKPHVVERPVIEFSPSCSVPVKLRQWALDQLVDVKLAVLKNANIPPAVIQRSFNDAVTMEQSWARQFHNSASTYKAFAAAQLHCLRKQLGTL